MGQRFSIPPLATLAGLVALVKAAEFAIDSQAVFYYDSGAFILNGLRRAFIPERSYVYGFLLRALAMPWHSLRAIVLIQVVMGGISAWLLGFLLIRYLNVRPWIAMAAALIFAVDPVQVVHEHMVMTETTTLLASAILFVALFRYLKRPDWVGLILLAFLGIVVVSLRVVYVPVVLAMAVLAPLTAWLWSPGWRAPRSRRGLAAALLLSCGATALFHEGYMHLTGYLGHRKPAYHFSTGYFLAAAVAPILKPDDAGDARVAAIVAAQQRSQIPLSNRDLRNSHLWDDGGLDSQIKAAFQGDPQAGNRAAEQLAHHAILRDPVGFANLAIEAYRDFWRGIPYLKGILPWDNGSGDKPAGLPTEVAAIQTVFGVDISGQNHWSTPSRRYHILGRDWNVFLLVSPVFAAFGIMLTLDKPASRLCAALLLVWSCLLITATCFGAVESSYRFLQPFSFTGLAGTAYLAEAIRRRLDLFDS